MSGKRIFVVTERCICWKRKKKTATRTPGDPLPLRAVLPKQAAAEGDTAKAVAPTSVLLQCISSSAWREKRRRTSANQRLNGWTSGTLHSIEGVHETAISVRPSMRTLLPRVQPS